MNRWSLAAVLTLVLAVWAYVGLPAAAKPPYPGLKGLDKVRIAVSVSSDVERQLRAAGAPNYVVASELSHLAETKLKEAGISAMGLSENGPKLSITANIDMETDEFTVKVTFSDYVSLVRDPSIKFDTNIWSKSGHPSSDEAKEMKAVVVDLLDQFIADRIAVNPEK